MKFYKLWFDDTNSDPFVCSEHDLKGVDEFFAYQTHRFESWPVPPPVFYGAGKYVQDYLESATNGWELFSDRVVSCFKKLDIVGVDFHPVQVIDTNSGDEVPGYSVIHVWNTIIGLDRQRAGWDEDPEVPNKVQGVYRFALIKERVLGSDAFRLAECEIPIFFSEKLTKAIEHTKATGFSFRPVPAN